MGWKLNKDVKKADKIQDRERRGHQEGKKKRMHWEHKWMSSHRRKGGKYVGITDIDEGGTEGMRIWLD